LFTLPFVALIAYTIAKHRLMDIRLAIFRALSLSFLVGAILLIYGLLFVTAVPYLSRIIGIDAGIVAAGVALVSVPFARYIQRILSRVTDRFLFQKRINYRTELIKSSQALSGTIQIDDVVKTILTTTEQIIRSRKTAIFLIKPERHTFYPIASRGMKELRITLPDDHLLVKHLQHTKKPVVKDELALEREQDPSPQHTEKITKIEESLNWLDASVVLPLFVNKKLTGLIVLGNKKSGDPYLQDDIVFLSSFAPQAATALQNARLYQESLEFGEKLKIEVKRATQELAVANEQLRDLDKAKSEFLSIASHQLYTPLTAIRGYLSMLLEKEYGSITKKQQPILAIIERSSNRLINLIKNLLDISRIESGRLDLNLESINLTDLINEMVMNLMPNAIHKKLTLHFTKPKTDLPTVVADRERIRQVLLNFIDNAIKYTDKGKITVSLAQEGRELVFSVTDTGGGLTRDAITKLFNKFTRVGGKARFRTEGTGLGLYVAKQIVKEHHGEVEVSSPGPHQGSTFAVRLPIEGSPNSLIAGQKTSVVIKAADSDKEK